MASIQPEHTVYSGPQAPGPKRVTLRSIRSKYSKGEPISVVTAYDYPSAVHVRPHSTAQTAPAAALPASPSPGSWTK